MTVCMTILLEGQRWAKLEKHSHAMYKNVQMFKFVVAENLVLTLIISDFLATELFYTKISRQRTTLNGFASATDY